MEYLDMNTPSAKRPEPAQHRRKRRRRKKGGRATGLFVLLCLLSLGGLTGCLLLLLKNQSLKNEVTDAMAYIDEVNSVQTYTGKEAQSMVESASQKAAQEAALKTQDEILSTMKTMMESGDGTAAMLRHFYPEEIVVGADNRYYFFPILDTLKHHSYEEEQFVLNEENVLEYIQDGQVVSRKGIDVSRYQTSIDWERVAADGVEYAFIRLGIRGSSEGKLVLDPTYQENVEGALANGLEVGVYFFTQALNPKEAEEEADFVLENLGPYDITWPIVLDVEEIETKNPRTGEMTRQEWTDVCIAFCERIKQAGYTPMIYGNLKTFMLMVDLEQLEDYEKWYAWYRTPLYFPYDFSVWQYTAEGVVDGIKGQVDLNVSMKDWGGE